jgi:pimeloyl-ACP methyl ester carboxylesterase
MPHMEQALSFTDKDGHRTAGILAAPAGPTDRVAVLCHGFLSNKNSTTNRTLTARLLEHGIATLRFDFFGQGESEGPFERITCTTAVNQAKAALDLAVLKGFRRIGLFGSSFGGLVAILTASARKDLVCLALKCPVPDFEEMLRLEFKPEGLEAWKRTNTIPNVSSGQGRIKLQYGFYEDCLRHIGYDAAKAVTVPTLIVQGDCDEYVPLHQARRLVDALQGPKRLEILPGADHGFTKPGDFERMIALLTDWLVAYLTPSEPRPF